ncbi:twin-arginine translocation signal domain-containing protein [Saccharothrix stipae]
MERRQALKTLAAGAVAAVTVPAVLAPPAQAGLLTGPGAGPYMRNMGTGIYVDQSTAQQMSTFSITPQLVTCGVGTFGVGQLALTGPFAMLMYSTRIDRYTVDPGSRTITATGRMRSITMIALGVVTESVEHDFIAVATNNNGVGSDRFDVHFVTPFWTPGLLQPMATPSSLRPGWARFGGNVATAAVTGTPLGGVNA